MKVGEINGTWSVLFRVMILLTTFIQPVALGWCAWCSTKLVAQGEAIAAIKANRFTSADALNMDQVHTAQILQMHNKIDTVVARMADKLDAISLLIAERVPKKVPPEWFEAFVRDSVASIDERLKRVEARMKNP